VYDHRASHTTKYLNSKLNKQKKIMRKETSQIMHDIQRGKLSTISTYLQNAINISFTAGQKTKANFLMLHNHPVTEHAAC
jgi:hypothetical protein